METKTLKTIQTLSKIGKVLSKIVFICCIVGAAGCVIGLIIMPIIGTSLIEIGGVTLGSLFEKSAEMSIGTCYAAMSMGLILCIAEIFIANMACKYFKNELNAGTPFTFDGAKEMLRLGICIIAISIGALIGADIAYCIFNACFSNVEDMHIDSFNQVGVGIAFIIMSLLCKLGAEKEDKDV